MNKIKQISSFNLKLLNIMVVACFLLSIDSFAQKEKKFIVNGNSLYEKNNFIEAQKNYQRALNKNKDSYKGSFNLGDAYYKQGKFEEAAEQFQLLTHRATSKDSLAKAYHNLGNSLLQSKKYQESVDAYKNALKNEPKDEDTRYNLSYAQQMLKQQQQQQQKDKEKEDKKDKENKKDKEKENKDEKDKKDKEKKEDKNKQNKDPDQKDKEKQQPQISKEDAQRLLDALQNDEKNLQDKLKKRKEKGIKVEIEKDW